jgi:serine/threonine protein kinase
MPDETPLSPSGPFFGNNPSDLMRGAIDPTQPVTDPRNWQPPALETLQAMLTGYKVQAFIARGGMGAVYRGEQISLGRPVAIKILPPALSDSDPNYSVRFKQEARAMAQLNHPAIVSVYDFGEMPDGTFYFIMEFMDGTDVGQMVTKQGRLPSAHAMSITAHVCDALQYAHERGIVHRDIKPANIMVGFDGRVKVADFGLAKSFRSRSTSLTQSGHVMGTPHFVAPEALLFGSDVDHRADIFAMGVMLYQMLTGKVPHGLFEMPSLQVPGLDPRYDVIISSAMREDREKRYQNVLEMRRALDGILTQPVLRSEVAKQTVPVSAVTHKKPISVATPPKPQSGQYYYRPPQATAPASKKQLAAGIWVSALVMLLGGIYWWRYSPSLADSASTVTAESAKIPAEEQASPTQVRASANQLAAWLEKATALVSEIPEEKKVRDRFLYALSRAHARLELNDEALKIARNVQDDAIRLRAITDISGELAYRGLVERATAIAHDPAIPSMHGRAQAMAACSLLMKKDFDGASALAAKVEDPVGAALFLSDAAALSHAAGDMASFDNKVLIASMMAQGLENQEDAKEALKKLAVMLVKKNQVTQALKVASLFRYHRFASPVIDIIGALADKGDFDAAERLREESAFTMYPSCTSGNLLALAYADHGNFGKAESIAKSLSYEDHAAATLSEVQVKAGQLQAARTTAAKLLKTDHLDGNRLEAYAKAFSKTTVLQARLEGLPATLNTLENEPNPVTRAFSYLALAEAALPIKPELPYVTPADAAKLATLGCHAQPVSRPPFPVLEFAGHRYQYVDIRCSWEEARDRAEAVGGYLASITSKEEQEWLANTFRKHLPSDYESIFLGGKCVNGAWSWSNSESFSYTCWHNGQPSDKKGNSYLDLRKKNGQAAWAVAWNARPNTSVGFIVEWGQPSVATVNVATVASAPHDKTNLRTFTDAKGRTVRAELIGVQNDEVTLKLENGKEHTLKAASFSAPDIEYFKTKGLVMPQTPTVAVTRAVPTLNHAPATRVLDPVNMMLKEPWMPHNIHTRKEWLAALGFYSKEITKQGVRTPTTIWGSFTWLMPLSKATELLPRGSYKLKSVTAAKLAYPEGITVEFWHVGGKGYEDNLELFDEIAFLIDDAKRLVSLQLGENGYKILNWRWQNKAGPDGDRNPYFDFLNDTANAKSGRKVFYQFRPTMPGVTNLKLVLDGSTSSHWYLTEPLAEKFTQIYAEVNKQNP